MLVEIAAGFVVANIYEDILLVLVGAVFQLSSCLWVCLLSVVGCRLSEWVAKLQLTDIAGEWSLALSGEFIISAGIEWRLSP
ncbi:hypothetical protein [Geopseudomonas sagittaria]|uniref:hypothetical protein n=1 Tax=Geopseudomonas sagittaria TaxID=1135990 RepID=UPI001113AC7A|nr:hypothetical protein [Pseudomonas sagittaria]